MMNLVAPCCLLILAAPIHGQAIHRVNGLTGDPGATSGKYDSITAAVGNASPGDIVVVEGIKNGGVWYGYTELPHPGNQNAPTGETFPISLDGVTVVKDPGTPDAVFVFTHSLATSALFEVVDTNGNADDTRIQDLFLAGGLCGVLIDITAAESMSVILDNVRFVRNRVGVKVMASAGGEIGLQSAQRLEVKDCSFFYTTQTGAGPGYPAFQTIENGLVFQGLDERAGSRQPSLGRIKATITNLGTSGDFEDIEAEAALIFGESWYDQMEFGSVPGGILKKISSVTLDIQGGDLDGRATAAHPNWGWAYGVRLVGLDPGQLAPPFSYSSACRADVTGAVLQAFRTTGIHVFGGRYTRSHVDLGSNTVIKNIGSQLGPSIPGSQHAGAGISATSHEAYISIESNGAEISDNWGTGIDASCGALITIPANTFVPWGVILDLEDSDVFLNGGDGLYLSASGDGIIGGTWSFLGFSQKTILRSDDDLLVNLDDPFPLLRGRGSVDRCAIHNNGFKSGGGPKAHGAVIELRGDANARDECMAALQFSNTLIWNNEGEGVFYDVGAAGYDNWVLAVPLVHCTVAGNGGAGATGNYNIEIRNLGSQWGYFQWQEPAGGGQSLYLNTKLLNTIFERQTPGTDDIGPSLFSLVALNDSYPSGTQLVKVRGLRTDLGQPYGETTLDWYTVRSSPFVGRSGGVMNWATLDRTDLYLDPNSTDMAGFQETPNFYGVEGEPSEIQQDLQPILRPPLIHPPDPSTSERDKGAHQTPTLWQ